MADNTTFYKYGDYYFIQSNKIKIYPCAFRGNNDDTYIDPESQLNTERNITLPSTIGHGNSSYVIEEGSSSTTEPWKVVIGGYYFEIYDELASKTCLGIKLVNKTIVGEHSSKFLATLTQGEAIPITELDHRFSNNTADPKYFIGLAFAENATALSGCISLDISAANTQRFAVTDTSLIKNNVNSNITRTTDNTETINEAFDTTHLNATNAHITNLTLIADNADDNRVEANEHGIEFITNNATSASISTDGGILSNNHFNLGEKLFAAVDGNKVTVTGDQATPTEIDLKNRNSFIKINSGDDFDYAEITRNTINLGSKGVSIKSIIGDNPGLDKGKIEVFNGRTVDKVTIEDNTVECVAKVNSETGHNKYGILTNTDLAFKEWKNGNWSGSESVLSMDTLKFNTHELVLGTVDNKGYVDVNDAGYINVGSKTKLKNGKVILGNNVASNTTDKHYGYIELDTTARGNDNKKINVVGKSARTDITAGQIQVSSATDGVANNNSSKTTITNGTIFTDTIQDNDTGNYFVLTNNDDGHKGYLSLGNANQANVVTLEGNGLISSPIIHVSNLGSDTGSSAFSLTKESNNRGKLIVKNGSTDTTIDGNIITTSDLKATNVIKVGSTAYTTGNTTNGIHIGNKIIEIYNEDAGGRIMIGTTKGEIEAQQFYARSDRRLKENIKDYKSENSILDLDVKEYNFIGKEEKQIGFIAQDLQEKFPELVKENSDGYLSIQESKLVYLLLEEVKKLKEEIKELKGE